ncbi:hypothetical protein RI129_009099 [Pyrocoelia pectoralis]|uniref:Uncharacterized protein n=1 Tax=Pyrocoelia pectoralis TaxID=417401 RepID=A0AAN7ZGI7_9COLE
MDWDRFVVKRLDYPHNNFFKGLLWPSLYGVISWWIPFKERSRFISCFQGLSIGETISQATSGFIIASVGWKYVFYIWGGIGIGKVLNRTVLLFESLGLLWCLFWHFLMYNKPELHPRISAEELNHIKKGREKVLQSGNLKVPWLSIICSLPVWAITVSAFGRMWYISVVRMYGPMYLKKVVGLNVQMVRQIIPGLLCISMSYLNCNLTLIIVVWSLSHIISTACFCGEMVNIVDVAPNFTGPVSSIIQTILMTPNIFSTLSNLESWRGIFNTSAGVAFATYLFYFLFASAEVQSWDKAVSSRSDGDELEALK